MIQYPVHCVSVRLWGPRLTLKRYRLQPQPPGEIPDFPKQQRTLFRSQRHVHPDATKAADHRGQILCQRGFFQTLPAGQCLVFVSWI